MPAAWKFFEHSAADVVRNPISGEFFSTEAVRNAADALVREGIQNALDARLYQNGGDRRRADIRIFLSGPDDGLPTARAERWFESLWAHILAPNNGISNQPALSDTCPFLVFEDFGTSGLTGDPGQSRPIANSPNNFFNFFRAEGHSDKGAKDRGSWGVGKTVFPRASRINSFLGLTVRDDDQRRLLLGRSILRYHEVESVFYRCDGSFGDRDGDIVLPCEDPALLDEFAADFRLQRGERPGLSVVMPWYDVEGDDAISEGKIITAVCRGFFYPILMGHLTVTVATPRGETTYDQNTIEARISELRDKLADELLPLVRLAEWGQTLGDPEVHSLLPPEPRKSQKWSSGLLSSDVATHIRDSLSRREPVALRVPMTIQRKTEPAESSFFKVFLGHGEGSSKPVFIREELIIPDVKAKRIAGVRALVVVEDAPLASMLRDAETPAHTQWNQNTSHFKNKYKFGAGAIGFVGDSVSRILQFVHQADRQPDPTLTIDYFSLPAAPEDDEAVPARRRKAKKKAGEKTPPETVPPDIQRRPKRFTIKKRKGGFAINAGDPDAALPSLIKVRVAYDVRRGNPLRKFHPADIDLRSLRFASRGETAALDGDPEAVEKAGLKFLVRPLQADFHLEVGGFDVDRDLFVRADVIEQPTEDPNGG